MGHNLLINWIFWGYKPMILTFDPNFQRDIQTVRIENGRKNAGFTGQVRLKDLTAGGMVSDEKIG